MTTTTALATRQDFALPELREISQTLYLSNYVSTDKNAEVGKAQILTRILAGRELGFGPWASVSGIHIIQGKPTVSANLMASAVKKSKVYDYLVTEMTDTKVSIEFFQYWDGKRMSIGVSTFTADDARKAGTQNMNKFPRNMLFARAMSNGVRWFCPDVFDGSAVYTPEELGATMDDDGNVVEVQATIVRDADPPLAATAKRPASAPEPTPTNGNGKHGDDKLPFEPNPEAAYEWAIGIGASENIYAARNAFKRMVDEDFGGKLTRANAAEVYAHWYVNRMDKLQMAAQPQPA